MPKLVTVRLLTAGPNKNYRKGQTVTVDQDRAAALVAGKHAEEVKDDAVGVPERKALQRGL